jgi:predicted GNAT family N-acyltransferase
MLFHYLVSTIKYLPDGIQNLSVIKKKKAISEKVSWVQCWRLTPVILATQEAVIRRIVVQSQPRGQIVPKTLSQKTQHMKGLEEWLKW